MPPPPGITRKLLFAFGALVALFAAASLFALGPIEEIHDGSHALQEASTRVRTSLELATAVRDEYAHLAHTIILGNDAEARARVEALTRRLLEQAQDAEERAWVGDIQESGDALDRLYRETLLPAVVAQDHAAVTAVHGRALELVAVIQARADVNLLVYGPSREQVVKAVLPSVRDPAQGVRNETMRLLGAAQKDQQRVIISLDTVLESLWLPTTSDRNKTAWALVRILETEGTVHRQQILDKAADPLLEMVAMQQTLDRGPAHKVFTLQAGGGLLSCEAEERGCRVLENTHEPILTGVADDYLNQ